MHTRVWGVQEGQQREGFGEGSRGSLAEGGALPAAALALGSLERFREGAACGRL